MLLRKLVRSILACLPIKLRCLIQSLRCHGRLQIGLGSHIHSSVHLLGKENIRVGRNTCVSQGSWLNINHRHKGKIAIEIGNNCFIGKNNFFTSGDMISIGDYTLTSIDCKFIGSTHKINDPEVPYLLTGTTDTDQIIIGVNCFIGAGVTVLGNVKVGHGSVIGANSLVLHDIPPFSIAIGNPAKIIKQYSFFYKAWLPTSEVLSENEMPSELEYLTQLKNKFPQLDMPWIAAGKSMGDL
jgi:acetyltransferase-like isoleucine patch superfamily enzyme